LKEKAEAKIGLPERTPAESSVNPGGSEDPVGTAQVIGVVPLAARVALRTPR
jgi:hypothetical protein